MLRRSLTHVGQFQKNHCYEGHVLTGYSNADRIHLQATSMNALPKQAIPKQVMPQQVTPKQAAPINPLRTRIWKILKCRPTHAGHIMRTKHISQKLSIFLTCLDRHKQDEFQSCSAFLPLFKVELLQLKFTPIICLMNFINKIWLQLKFYLSGNGVAITLSVDVGWKNSVGIFLDHFMGKIIIIMYRLVL